MYGTLVSSYSSQRWSYLIGILPVSTLDSLRVKSSPYKLFSNNTTKFTIDKVIDHIEPHYFKLSVPKGYGAISLSSQITGTNDTTALWNGSIISGMGSRYVQLVSPSDIAYTCGKTNLTLSGTRQAYGAYYMHGTFINCDHAIVVYISPRSHTDYGTWSRSLSQIMSIDESADANGIIIAGYPPYKYRFLRIGIDNSIIFTIYQQYIKQSITISFYLYNKDDPSLIDPPDIEEDLIYYNKHMRRGTSKKYSLSHTYCDPEHSEGVVISNYNSCSMPEAAPIYAHAEYISVPISSDWLLTPNGITRYRYKCNHGDHDIWGRCKIVNQTHPTVPIVVCDTKDDFPNNLDDIDQNTFYIAMDSLSVYVYDYTNDKYKKWSDDVIAFDPLDPPSYESTTPSDKIYISITDGRIYRYLNTYVSGGGPYYRFRQSYCEGWVETSDHSIAIIRAIDMNTASTIKFIQSIPEEYQTGELIAGISNISSDSTDFIGSIDRIEFKFKWSEYSSNNWYSSPNRFYTELNGDVYAPYTTLSITSDFNNNLERIEFSKIFAFPGTYYINSSGGIIGAVDIGGLWAQSTPTTINIEVKNPIPSIDITYEIVPLEKGKSRIIVTRPHEPATVMFFSFVSNLYSNLKETLYTKTWDLTIGSFNYSGNYVTNDITSWYYYNPLSDFCNTRYEIEPISVDFDLGQIIPLEYYAENDDFDNTFNTDIDLSWPTPISAFTVSIDGYNINCVHNEDVLYHSCSYWNWEIYDEDDNLLYSTTSDEFEYTVPLSGIYKIIHTTSNPIDTSTTIQHITIP